LKAENNNPATPSGLNRIYNPERMGSKLDKLQNPIHFVHAALNPEGMT
jgi:hypothetical protein